MRDPDGGQAENVGEEVVRQRAATFGRTRALAGRRLEGAPGEGDPRMLGIDPGRAEIAPSSAGLDLHPAVRVQRAADRRQKFPGSVPTTKRISQVALGARRDRVDRVVRVAGGPGEHLEAAPAEYLLARAQARLAPAGSISGSPAAAAIDRSASARCTEFGDACGIHSRNPDGAAFET